MPGEGKGVLTQSGNLRDTPWNTLPFSDRETRDVRRRKGSTHAVWELEGIHRGTLFPLVIERQGLPGEGKGVLTQSGNLRGYTVEHSSL